MFLNKLSPNKTFVRSGQNRPQNGIIWPRQKDSMFFFCLFFLLARELFALRQKKMTLFISHFVKRGEQCSTMHPNTEAQVFTVHRANNNNNNFISHFPSDP